MLKLWERICCSSGASRHPVSGTARSSFAIQHRMKCSCPWKPQPPHPNLNSSAKKGATLINVAQSSWPCQMPEKFQQCSENIPCSGKCQMPRKAQQSGVKQLPPSQSSQGPGSPSHPQLSYPHCPAL